MNSAILTISCILFFLAGYKFYSKYLSEKIHKLFQKNIFPEVKLESQRLIDLIINNRSTKKVRIHEKN